MKLIGQILKGSRILHVGDIMERCDDIMIDTILDVAPILRNIAPAAELAKEGGPLFAEELGNDLAVSARIGQVGVVVLDSTKDEIRCIHITWPHNVGVRRKGREGWPDTSGAGGRAGRQQRRRRRCRPWSMVSPIQNEILEFGANSTAPKSVY